MAKLLLKFQRFFRRKPIRFFTFIILYLTAGSLVFLHSGFVGETAILDKDSTPNEGISEGAVYQELGFLHLGRVFKGNLDSQGRARRFGQWSKTASQDSAGRTKSGSHAGAWSRGLKGRTARQQGESKAKYIGCYMDNTKQRALHGTSFYDYRKMTVFRCQDNCAERGYLYAGLEFGAECYCGHKIQASNVSDSECSMECKGEKNNICGGRNRLSIYRLELTQESTRRYGSAIFRGCFSKPDNVSFALPVSAVMLNTSVDKCVDFCTEKEYPLAVLARVTCYCGFPTTHFTLHEREDEQLCAHKCSGEEFESCGNDNYFVAYQTQVQDNRCMDRKFLPSRSKQLVALASFPGAGNTWARHLIELATGYYTGSYYFDGSLYNKGFKGERDHWKSGRTICIKTHESGRKEIETFGSAILLIRNPYKALMAEFNRKYGGHIGFASQAHWKEWPEFVKNYAPWWASHTIDWLKYGKNVLVVHFEDLKHDLFNQLKRMVSLLDFNVLEDRLLCVEGQKDGNFKRSGLRKLEYDPYTPEMRQMIDNYIKTVDSALKLRKLTGVPDDYLPR
ncbi:sialate:O-sulfotransferase 2 isoform X2 [Latimeria chalumnae]|uniref:sialate:O-sulfotransferase 2 isoform X2 n=1 Tax=Latimeria chalumnae TaxID=7897 RepID=UPI0003C10FB2|nr:PREDICTED: WSC domain-containing protein 2 isoform X2 [Latimeria chalumnae]|eukprot:XP_006010796.1 PREDICTED: WSC domain-containing protein 2 isoform X2 [Latimeria chalumnae]